MCMCMIKLYFIKNIVWLIPTMMSVCSQWGLTGNFLFQQFLTDFFARTSRQNFFDEILKILPPYAQSYLVAYH